MKPSWSFVASSLCASALAVRPSVGPETARLILAQRLGLSRYHSIAHADPETIRHINAFGGRQRKLLGGDDADQSKAHLLMWIENVEQDEATGMLTVRALYTRDHGLMKGVSHRQRWLRSDTRFCYHKSTFSGRQRPPDCGLHSAGGVFTRVSRSSEAYIHSSL